jgi:outer membrane receptor for ferrienterochelin and colicins
MSGERLSQRIALAVLLAAAAASPVSADGRLEGRVTRSDGSALSGVSVLLNQLAASTLTDPFGRFVFENVPAGTFSVTLALGPHVLTVQDIVVGNDTVFVERAVDWAVSYADTITVYAASRRTERFFEAPASVAVIAEETISRESGTAQVPRLLQSTAGIDVAQSGMFDFNVNVRGLNVSLNRRVLTRLDGRDLAAVLAGSQEWAAIAVPMDEIARIEVVRGPASALYGANAFNGVIDMTTREPRYTRGGSAQISIGDIATRRASLRHAGPLAGNWFYRAHAAYGQTRDFAAARTESVEYPGLPTEVAAPTGRTQFGNVGLRLDRSLSPTRLFTAEGGWVRTDGNVVLTGAGRPQNQEVDRPWFRSEVRAPAWRLSGYYDGRRGRMLSLASGATIVDDSMRLHAEIQRRFNYQQGRGAIISGAATRFERADTRDDSGASTILRGVHTARSAAVYGQVDHGLASSLRLIAAARVDASSLHSPQLSPKAGLVYAVSPLQRIRVTFGHAYQTGSFIQYFTRTAARPPIALGGLEAALRPALGGVPLGLDSVPFLVVGNEQLEVEKIDSLETGYSGVFGGRVVIGADYYYNRVGDLITSLLPQVGTTYGRVNPQFGPYQPPAALSAAQQSLVRATLQSQLPPPLFALLSNDLDGTPIFAAVSLRNVAHRVTQHGAEFNIQYFATNRLAADAGYSWLRFDGESAAADDPISGNSPPHRVTAGLTYAHDRVSVAARYRWADRFQWIGGIFRGPVPSYSVTDLSASYRLPGRRRVVANIANAFDNRHYEIFGGDILRRSALLTLVQEW